MPGFRLLRRARTDLLDIAAYTADRWGFNVARLGIGVRLEEELADAVKRKALVHVLPGWRFGEPPAYLLTTVGRRDLPRVRVVAEAVAVPCARCADGSAATSGVRRC